MEILAFNKWSTQDIQIEDPGLKNYIQLEPQIVPRSSGRFAKNQFHKSNVFIVERLINRIMCVGHQGKKHTMSSGHITGKKISTHAIVEKVFEVIEKRTNENPIKVFVKAIENAAPREEIITIEYGGAKYPKAVEVAPQRRIDLALKLMAQGSYKKSFNAKRSIVSALSNEIMAAYNFSNESVAVSKKLELERQADSSR